MTSKYVGYRIVAMQTDRSADEVEKAIQLALGCDDTEDPCVMVLMESCTGTQEQVWAWMEDK